MKSVYFLSFYEPIVFWLEYVLAFFNPGTVTLARALLQCFMPGHEVQTPLSPEYVSTLFVTPMPGPSYPPMTKILSSTTVTLKFDLVVIMSAAELQLGLG